VLRTVFGGDGVQAAVEPIPGGTATLESEIERFADGSFVETGTIEYGGAGRVSFVTLGRGTVGPSPIPGLQRGAVIWEITGGTGGLAGAQGIITSNFAVNAGGDVVDDHVARIWIAAG
jgi:hypothetical protein